MALDGFFSGVNQGVKLSGSIYDAEIDAAKDSLVLQGLYDTYGDNQVLRPDALRNAKAQYDYDTAAKSANLDTLHRTHDGAVDATISQNQYNKSNYDNLAADIDMWGLDRRESELKRLKAIKQQYSNKGFSEGVIADVNSQTRGAQVDTGLFNIGAERAQAKDILDNNLTAVEINQYTKPTAIINARRQLVDATTGYVIADLTESDLVTRGVIDAKNLAEQAGYSLQTTQATGAYGVNTAANNAFIQSLTSDQQKALSIVTTYVSGKPAAEQIQILQDVATKSNDPSQRSAAQALLNNIESQKTGVNALGGSSAETKLTHEQKLQLDLQKEAQTTYNRFYLDVMKNETMTQEEKSQALQQAKIDLGITQAKQNPPQKSLTPEMESAALEYGIMNFGWARNANDGKYYNASGSPVSYGDVTSALNAMRNRSEASTQKAPQPNKQAVQQPALESRVGPDAASTPVNYDGVNRALAELRIKQSDSNGAAFPNVTTPFSIWGN